MDFMTKSKIAVVGAGSVGSLVALRLFECGNDVFLYDYNPVRAEKISQQLELLPLGEDEPKKMRIHVLSDKDRLREANIAVVAVKSYSLLSVIELLKEVLNPDCLIVTLQNGLSVRPLFLESFDSSRVYSAVTNIGANKLSDTLVKETGQGITYLEKKEYSAAISSLLANSGFTVELAEDISRIIWQKAAINCAINPLGAILQLKNGALAENTELLTLMSDIAGEVEEVARAAGHDISQDWTRTLAEICVKTAENYNSMAQDVQRGKKTEIDALNGAVCKTAEKLSLKAPLNSAFAALVRAL